MTLIRTDLPGNKQGVVAIKRFQSTWVDGDRNITEDPLLREEEKGGELILNWREGLNMTRRSIFVSTARAKQAIAEGR